MNKKILSLEFFAERFGLVAEQLSYGIGKMGKEVFPVILVEGSSVFIHIEEDVFYPRKLPDVTFTFTECDFYEEDDGYVFSVPHLESIKLSRESIERYYAGKYYSEST
ncbi:MAG: hypothetical protein LBI15_02880 [Dysgonamonadaceae bacterium]|jgi:hypothetical protein|nr:hypothetical protein [Dysgonamonadaceae bacterium]